MVDNGIFDEKQLSKEPVGFMMGESPESGHIGILVGRFMGTQKQ